MKIYFLLSWLVLSTGALLYGEENSNQKSCFRVGDISNWQALDNERLIVWSPSKSHPYLVTLFNHCPGLRFEDVLIFESTLWRTCSNYNDKIHTELMPCMIKDIKEINEEEVNNLIELAKSSKEELVLEDNQ